MTHTNWTALGGAVTTPGELDELIGTIQYQINEMRVGIARAAWGAQTGRTWDESHDRPSATDILHDLDMTVVPPGTTPTNATARNAIAAATTAMAAAEQALLTAWLAHRAAEPA
ncbi:hypothetical protein [Stackebrandtia soli]|uniref:hypothetical protein n=1 Tax=Stackebrandtia soli TaxID=1892856 RepID=UPI0039E9323D